MENFYLSPHAENFTVAISLYGIHTTKSYIHLFIDMRYFGANFLY